MKKFFVIVLALTLVSFYGCGKEKSEKKEEKVTIQSKDDTKKVTEPKMNNADLVALGKKLFKDKTCFTCHLADTKAIGPSIKEINKIYSDKGADIVTFLKSEMEPIVDTDPGQVAVMKANLDGFVSDLKDEELMALKAYMLSVK